MVSEPGQIGFVLVLFLGVDKMSKCTTKFKIPKFDGKNFAIWKMMMHVILVKEGYAVALKGRCLKPSKITYGQFTKKDKIANVDILLALDDKIVV